MTKYSSFASTIHDVIFVVLKYSSLNRQIWNMEDRLREVVRHIGPSTLAKSTSIDDRRRWQTVATDVRTKTRVEDLSALLDAYPQYELYIIRGKVDPGKGQISPSYTEADIKLEEPKTGSR